MFYDRHVKVEKHGFRRMWSGDVCDEKVIAGAVENRLEKMNVIRP